MISDVLKEKIKHNFFDPDFYQNTDLYEYVDENNIFIQEAKKIAEKSGCIKQQTGGVIVKNGQIIASGSNAGIKVEVCPRDMLNLPTGVGYEHCKKDCEQFGHAEMSAVHDAKIKNIDIMGADFYLWGHWWCCENCWKTMINVGIKNVFLVKKYQ